MSREREPSDRPAALHRPGAPEDGGREPDGLAGRSVALCGDLSRNRTAHSLAGGLLAAGALLGLLLVLLVILILWYQKTTQQDLETRSAEIAETSAQLTDTRAQLNAAVGREQALAELDKNRELALVSRDPTQLAQLVGVRANILRGAGRLDEALQPFVQASVVRMDLRQMFTEILVEAAFSSGSVSPEESAILERVATRLRIPAPVFAAMMNARGGAGAAGGQGGSRRAAGRPLQSIEQSFAQLGLKPSASDADVKKAYRKLVSQYHPDKLVSRGLPEEMMEMAKTRVREINKAYEHIKQARGIK